MSAAAAAVEVEVEVVEVSSVLMVSHLARPAQCCGLARMVLMLRHVVVMLTREVAKVGTI